MMTPRRRIALAVLASVLLLAAAGYLFWPKFVEHQVDYKMPGYPGPKIAAAKAAVIERRERIIDQTIWRKEIEAEEYGRVFENFWDALNAATNKWPIIEALDFESAVLGEWKEKESLGHAIERWNPAINSGTRHLVSYDSWRAEVQKWKDAGWEIMQCEFRHNAFDPQTNDLPAKSKFYLALNLTNATPARATVEGDLFVEWNLRQTNQSPTIRKIDASALSVMYRPGPAPFVEVLKETLDPPDLSLWIEPLLVYDLDNDGIPEIALPSLNRLYRWRKDHYEVEKFCATSRLQILNGLLADFDGDGVTDFLYVEFDGIFLLKGSHGGKFETPPRLVGRGPGEFSGPRTLTCGDIDGDGDLDVFLAQYRPPLELGTMPTPYYDANDVYPAYLFINDGRGNLTESIKGSGLEKKRFRRTLGASFVDLDGDGALDLIVTSDFAGVDLYRNIGGGHFEDVSSEWLDERHAFGMSHTFADFDADGRLDFVVAGMMSATVDRLEHFGISRPNSHIDPTMRAKMAYGNRLYFGKADGGFLQVSNVVVRAGWTWGVCAGDFDNDGFPDVYVGNGMLSGRSVHDVEGELWLRDMFLGTRDVDVGVSTYFSMKSDRLTRQGWSQGGYDRNRLYLNRRNREFVDVAHLFGIALPSDCRNIVAADLDNDGRIDLVVTSVGGTLSSKQTLQVFRNQLADAGNSITLEFQDEPGLSSVGATAVLKSGDRKMVDVNVTGDSFRSQHPNVIRFGLGKIDKVDEVEIKWPGGAVKRIPGPKVNQTQFVRAPGR